MKNSSLRRWIEAFVDPRRTLNAYQVIRYLRNLRKFRAMGGRVALADTYPCLSDRTSSTPFDAHYFYQAAWIARRLALHRPENHTDIGSHNMIIAVVSGFVPCHFIDYRPLQVGLSNLESRGGSILELPAADRSLASVSCLHVIEHIGLGRYGDPLDVEGHIKAARELQRVVGREGRLYLATPVGRSRVQFDAHRVSSPDEVVTWFNELELTSFSAVDDQGRYHEGVSTATLRDARYGCGLFEFRRPA